MRNFKTPTLTLNITESNLDVSQLTLQTSFSLRSDVIVSIPVMQCSESDLGFSDWNCELVYQYLLFQSLEINIENQQT